MKKEFDTDFELNIASIVDCLTVLITYLLASATFISLGMMTVSLPSFSDEYPASDKPQITLTIQILKNQGLKVVSEGIETSHHKIDGEINSSTLEELTADLKKFKTRFPQLDGVVIAAENSVQYKALVAVVEATRAVLPQIAISTEEVSARD